MKDLHDISSLIAVRNFLATSIDNMYIKLSKEEIKQIQAKIPYIDRAIVERSLKLDLSQMETINIVRSFAFESTEKPELVMEKIPLPENPVSDFGLQEHEVTDV